LPGIVTMPWTEEAKRRSFGWIQKTSRSEVGNWDGDCSGKSAESLLIQAVAGVKEDLVMPKEGERLTAEQVGLLRAWIDQERIARERVG